VKTTLLTLCLHVLPISKKRMVFIALARVSAIPGQHKCTRSYTRCSRAYSGILQGFRSAVHKCCLLQWARDALERIKQSSITHFKGNIITQLRYSCTWKSPFFSQWRAKHQKVPKTLENDKAKRLTNVN